MKKRTGKFNKTPRILIWDLETALSIITTFSLYPQYHHYNAIRQESNIICASWRWLGQQKIESISVLTSRKLSDDKPIVKKLAALMDEADATITHNGTRFDHKILNNRLLLNGLKPCAEPVKIDTLKIAKKHFNLMSNRLDYLGQLLDVGAKIPTTPGLWAKCLDGDRKAIAQMVSYNRGDVKLLDDVYQKLAPFATAQLNQNLVHDRETDGCPSCGEYNIVLNGHRFNRTTVVQRYKCLDCGHHFVGRKSLSRALFR